MLLICDSVYSQLLADVSEEIVASILPGWYNKPTNHCFLLIPCFYRNVCDIPLQSPLLLIGVIFTVTAECFKYFLTTCNYELGQTELLRYPVDVCHHPMICVQADLRGHTPGG